MTQHRHTIPKGANQTASVTDPDLSPYAKTTALQAEAASRLAADAALGNRVSTLEASMANVLLRLAAVEAHFTPPAPPSAPLTAVYGSGIGLDGIGNTSLGGPSHPLKSTMRFRATLSGVLNAFRVYVLGADEPGYGGGTGGTARFSIQTDDPSTHAPTGTVLATVDYSPVSGAGRRISFGSPPALVAGTLYHLVCENVDASPTVNFFALDYIYRATPQTPMQPRFADLDWAHGFFDSGAWTWRQGYTPILDLEYAAGHQGCGYMEASYGTGQVGQISGASLMVRETFTVSGGNRSVSQVGLRLVRQSGSDPLIVTLASGGTVLATASIPAASVNVGGSGNYGQEGAFTAVPLSVPIVLVNGTTYHLTLSTASGTIYWAFVSRRGSDYGYDPATYFADGVAEKTTDGSAWASLGRVTGENDLQFYLT